MVRLRLNIEAPTAGARQLTVHFGSPHAISIARAIAVCGMRSTDWLGRRQGIEWSCDRIPFDEKPWRSLARVPRSCRTDPPLWVQRGRVSLI